MKFIKTKKAKIIVLLCAVVLVGALAALAAGLTGAYLSDTKTGQVTGTFGDITITTSGGIVGQGDGINFLWDEMLPGVQYTAPITVTSTSSSNNEDLYMLFPNATALSALNSLGRFGAVTIDVLADGSPSTTVFSSNNLNDIPNNGSPVPLPAKVTLASNISPGEVVVVTFKFEYASKMTTPEPGNVFNQYPVLLKPGDTQDPRYPVGYAQYTVVAGQTGNGLPFQIVATQPGVQPGDGGGYAPILP